MMSEDNQQSEFVSGVLLETNEFTVTFRNVDSLPPGTYISFQIIVPGKDVEIETVEEVDPRD